MAFQLSLVCLKYLDRGLVLAYWGCRILFVVVHELAFFVRDAVVAVGNGRATVPATAVVLVTGWDSSF